MTCITKVLLLWCLPGEHVGPLLVSVLLAVQTNALLLPVVSHVHVTSASFVVKFTAHAKVTSSPFVKLPDTSSPLAKEGRVLRSQVSDYSIISSFL